VDYPLLVPLSVARGWTFAGRETTAVPAVLAAIFALGIVLAAATSVGRVRSWSRGLLTAAAILACPTFVKYSSSQCADVPLAFFILAAFLSMSRAFESASNRGAWLIAGAAVGLAAWTKNEGLLFLVVCVTVVAIRSIGGGRPGLKCAGALLLGALPMVVALVALKALASANDLLHAQSAQSLVTAFGSVDRVATVAAGFGQALWFGGAGAVGVLPIVAAFLFVVGLDRPLNPVPLIALIAMGLLIAGYAGVYVMTPHDLEWQMKTSLDRVILHAFPTLVWSVMMLARE
jgi:4-amino-4-deoxy-L-arabinose transferase-like glycosyltransferase